VEQILASHPDVYGAGELPWFTKAESALSNLPGSSRAYPECVTDLEAGAISMLSTKYLEYLDILSGHGQYSRVIDKMPDNFMRLGLISLLFPGARIIHCQRDPLDNCISQFNLLFPDRLGYSFDLYSLGAYTGQYQRLMRHWHNVMPVQILNVSYEKLVHDQEGGTRQLLGFVGLDWDEACLRFFESKRTVRTASEFQVRQPVYTSSVGRWKHYESFLAPFREGLQNYSE
jgi:hypothetical protein